MPVTTTISTILLIIYALSTGVMSTSPVLGHKSISARHASHNVKATLFNDTSCGHSHISEKLDTTLTYGVMQPATFTIQSYTLGRSLALTEQLDFYAVGSDPEDCGNFLQITSPDSNGNALHKGTCYLIVGGAGCVVVGIPSPAKMLR